jgi:hypothetical protein
MQKRRNQRKRTNASGLSIDCPNLRPSAGYRFADAWGDDPPEPNGQTAESWNDLCKAHCKDTGAAKY